MRKAAICACSTLVIGCAATEPLVRPEVVPAVEFAKAVEAGGAKEFTLLRTSAERQSVLQPAILAAQSTNDFTVPVANQAGDPRFLEQGYRLRNSIPVTRPVSPEELAAGTAALRPEEVSAIPPGSRAPYYRGQMTSNASLWPDEGQANFLYRDVRAFQPLDVVTIVINEKSEGRKKAETDTETKTSLLLAVANFFGFETKRLERNNTGLDAENLVNATTNSKFEGEGETKRSGTLTARISAVVLEVLPNGLLRVEGTKIVSVDREEEVMVISGLVRPRDITADNQVDSSRVANMRIDFYGRGVIGDTSSPGWLTRFFNKVWPF